MLASLFAFTYAFIIFAMLAEVETGWLKVIGFLAATWMAVAGAIAGWQANR